MTYANAVKTINAQERNLKKVDGYRIFHNGYEYRLKWFGGFGAYVGIDRRRIGKRKFEYFDGIGGYKYWLAGQIIDKAMEIIERRTA